MKNFITDYYEFHSLHQSLLEECELISEQTDAQIERKINYETERLAYYRSREEATAQGAARGTLIGSILGGLENLITRGGKGIADDTVKGAFVGAGIGLVTPLILRTLHKNREQKKMLQRQLEGVANSNKRDRITREIKELTLKELVILNRIAEEKLKRDQKRK